MTPRPRRGLVGSLAAFGARGVLRIGQWRARRELRGEAAPAGGPVFRGFIQINLIRTR